MIYFISAVLMIMNLRSFILMGMDKKRSIENKYRISEAQLCKSAWQLGSVGFILGMKYFRHKTLKKSFIWTGRLSLLTQLIMVAISIFFYLSSKGIIESFSVL